MTSIIKYMHDSPDLDAPVSQFRKSLQQRARGKRTVSHDFMSLTGRAVPRQGILSYEMMLAVYKKSELIRACIDTIVELICNVDWDIRPVDEDRSKWLKLNRPDDYKDQRKRIKWATKFFKNPNDQENYDTFTRKLIRDLLIYDAGAYEIVEAYHNGRSLPVELGVIPGDTIELETTDQGVVKRYWQSHNVLRNVNFETDEIAYLMLNPSAWTPYGFSPIETFFASIATDLHALKYNSQFFEKDGTPRGLLAVLGIGGAEYKKLMGEMRAATADNPHNLHTIRVPRNPETGKADEAFSYVPLGQTHQEMEFPELMRLCVTRVCMAYKITPSVIGFTDEVSQGLGNATPETQRDIFEDKAIAPLLRKLERSHTSRVIRQVCGWDDIEFAYVQENTPSERQEYQDSLIEVQTGIQTINEFRSKYGSRKPVEWGDMPLNPPPNWQPQPSPAEMQQQMMGQQQQQQMMDQQQQVANQVPGQQFPPQPKPPQVTPMQKSITITL